MDTTPSRRRVVVANPADGGFRYWLAKLYAFGFVGVLVALLASLPVVYLALAAHAPDPTNIALYADHAALESRIEAADGTPLSTLAEQRRYLVTLDEIPPMLVNAFLAVEDRKFFTHGGIDVRGIARAAWTNLRAGRVLQGGSTITQQVAKSMLSPERSITRKLKEIVLARRIETRFDKQQILYYYLNEVFLGSEAYGVSAAARHYFGKTLDQLTLAESALIAGLVKAPSRFSPRRHPERARRRRDDVLRAMHAAGFIPAADLGAALAEPLVLTPRLPAMASASWIAPHFAEHVRRRLVDRYGKSMLYRAGWQVSTTVDVAVQALALRQSQSSVQALDKRQGWRGPVRRLTGPAEREAVLERIQALYDVEALRLNRPYLAVVERVRPHRAFARIGRREVTLPLEMMSWAAPYSRTDPQNNQIIEAATEALRAGDLVWVVAPPAWRRHRHWGSASDATPVMMLHQQPRVEAALYAYDVESGYVMAMVGGLDFDRSSFNRVVQACRQPGSAYKPIYYSLALDGSELSMGTILQDKPYIPEPGEDWNPQNIHGTLAGEVTMHYALVKSLNLPSIQLLESVGPEATERWARRLGFTTPIVADKGLALGSSCTRIDELTHAFAVFGRRGTSRRPIAIRQIRDRQGRLVVDQTVPEDPLLDEENRLDRLWATSLDVPRRVIDPRTAFLTTKLLRDSVLRGIAARCQIVPVPTAGKGGTSSDTLDTWFVGFTSQWAATAWMGDDTNQRPLGVKEASYTTAIPMWANFMKAAVGARPHRELATRVPAGLESAEIDMLTGGSPQPDHPSVRIYFKPGTFTPPEEPLDEHRSP